MKDKLSNSEKSNTLYLIKLLATSAAVLFFMLLHNEGKAATKTSAATGLWSASGTWSPVGVPASGDDVIIHGGNVVTIDGAYTCNNLNVGDATSGVTTLKITTAGNSLTINGALKINNSNVANTYTLDAGPGTISVSGTFPTWGTAGTNSIKVGTGTLTFTPAVSIASANQNITFTAAGTINFNSSFTDSYNKLVTFAACIVNFASSYTVSTTNASWAGKGTAYFSNTANITANSNLTLYNVQVQSSASTTLVSAAGTVIVGGTFTLASSSAFTANENFEVDGNWTNNGGTFTIGTNTVILNGAAQTIGGSSSTAFATVQVGTAAATTAAITMNTSTTCNYLTFAASNNARTFTVAGGTTLTVNNDVTINQATAAVTNTLAVNTGTCNVSGNLIFAGTNNTTTYIAKVAVTTGTFTLSGNVTWMANTAVATEVISVTAGSLTFSNSLTMGDGSGTLAISSTGTINFNGTSAPSFTFGGTSTAPVFTTTNGCTLNFVKGFTNNTNALTLAATSNCNLTGNGTITPNAAVTFGNVALSASVSETLAAGGGTTIVAGTFTLAASSTFTASQNFEVDGNWTNNGGTLSASGYTVTLNGAAQTVAGSSSTTFPTLQIGTGAAATVAVTMNTNTTCSGMTFAASNNVRTFTLGAATTLTINGDLTINQPTAAVTNNLLINASTCTVSGNLIFTGTDNTATYVSKVTVTTGSFTLSGTITWMANTAVATEVITATTGTLTFGSSVTMGSGSGTLSVTSTGTINFNGTTAPSFTFGGATAPVFTTTNGCTLNFAKGFTNNTNALVLAATSNCNLTGNGTTTPNAAITFGNVIVNASVSETLANGGGTVIVAGTFTLANASTFTANQNFEVDGNWTNNGGTLSGGSNTVTLNGAAQTIGGTASTTFPILQLGTSGTAVTEAVTMNINTTCGGLVFSGAANARTFTLAAATTLTDTGALTMNQPTAAVTNNLLINASTCTVGGNLTFSGASNTATFITKITVTTGSFTVSGTVTWMGNTAVATEVITATTGTLTFGSSLTMGSGSGTLSVTSTGTINFNGTTAPSLTFGGATSPVLTTTNGCTLNFAAGLTNNSNALVLAATSNAIFTGNGDITPNLDITFGNLQINAATTLNAASGVVLVAGNFTLSSGSAFTANQDFEVDGNWTNNGGTLTATGRTITLNGAVKTIGGTSSTTFPTLQLGNTNTAIVVSYTMNNDNSCTNLIFSAYTKSRTLTLALGTTLTVSGNLTLNQSTVAATNTLAVNGGTCALTGNLIFGGSTNTATFICKVAVTSGAFTVNGTVTWMGNTAVATEVITVSTGTITFGHSLTMGSGSGTLSATSTGTINFNGTTAPSLNFGGAATVPVFTTTAGCKLYFAKGFTNNTNTLTLNATSSTYFTGTGTITPNAAINFGHVTVNASAAVTLAAGSLVIAAGDALLSSGSTFTMNQNFEVDGNWTNNGGTLSGGAYTFIFNGATKTIGGTSSTTFPILQLGKTAVALNYTMNNSNTCSSIVYNANTKGRTLALASGVTLTVTGNVTMNQPTASLFTNDLAINAGTCTIGGNLAFVGANNTTTRVCQIDVTSGSLSLTGTLTWMANTVVATEVINLGTGSITFANPITMGSSSGTFNVTGAGTVNFNYASGTSFTFGGATAPVFTTVIGSTFNFKKGITAATTPLAFAAGSYEIFTGSGSVTPTAAITFGNIQIANSCTLTAAGNFSVLNNWTDYGTFVPSTFLVTFSGSGTQVISRSGGETFYQVTASTIGSVFKLSNNVTITNSLTMNGHDFNLNNYILTLGNGSGASLSRTTGTAYGGTWKRYIPATAITSNSGSYYGLFPIGSSTAYKYISLNTTVNPTTPGYISATHTDLNTATNVIYTDNEGSVIEQIGDMHSDLTTTSLAGGTYNIDVAFASFNSAGSVSNYKLETHTSGVMGSCGTHVATTGTGAKPVTHRTGITCTQLNNAWVVGTNDRNLSPLYDYFYSRKTGNWNDATVGNGTWSLSPGGPSCDCVPTTTSYEVISNGTTVTVNTNDTTEFIDIDTGGTLIINGSKTLLVNGNIDLYGTGTFTNNGTLTVTGNIDLSSASSPTSSGNVTVGGDFMIPAGITYTQSGGTLTDNGDFDVSGTLQINAGASVNLAGNGTDVSGTGTVTTGSGVTINITNNKTITTGSVMTFGSSGTPATFALASGTTVNSAGTITINGSLTGAASNSTWINNANSTLNVTGALLSTGTLDGPNGPNTVNYSGTGSQNIKVPASSYYDLAISTSGTKSLTADVQADNSVTISGTAIFDETTHVLSGNASLNMSGTSELKLQRSVYGVYPELKGTYTLTGGTVTLNQTGDSAVLESGRYYNLKLNGSTPYDISGTANIDGNLDVLNTSNLNGNMSATIAGTFTHSSTGYSTLTDDIQPNAIVLSGGTLDDGGYNILMKGSGNWTHNGGTYTATGQANFCGTGAQTIGGSVATTFHDLVINNSSNVTLNASPAAATKVQNVLDLTNGKLITNSSNILRMLDTSSVINDTVGHYVEGPMVKVGNADFIFPVGKGGRWRRVGISGLASATTEVTAEYFATAYSNTTTVTAPIHAVSDREYWMVDRTVTADPVKLRLFWEDASVSNIIGCSSLTVAHWYGGSWIDEPATSISGSVCSGTGSGSIELDGTVTNFSPFTFGEHDNQSLPIQLVSFTAVPSENAVQTNWKTALEINNHYFNVERSADAITFEGIAQVQGAGNSTTEKEYKFLDVNPLKGTSYYRLRQTDFDGHFTYSDIVPVTFAEQSGLLVYPNPTDNELTLAVSHPGDEITVVISDITGRKMYGKVFKADENSTENLITLQAKYLLPSGIYLLKATTNGTDYTQRIVLK